MQRLGRKGHPTYRVVVQDSRQTPTSGKYVAMLGSYDPHAKTNTLVKDKAQFYLDHGAQPSDRVVKLFASEGIKLPKWVNEPTKQERSTRNPEKLRKNQPEQPAEEAAPEEVVAEAPVETPEAEAEEKTTEDPKAEDAPTQEVAEAPTEEPTSEEASEITDEENKPAEAESEEKPEEEKKA